MQLWIFKYILPAGQIWPWSKIIWPDSSYSVKKENILSLLVFDHKNQSLPISHYFHLGLVISNGFYRLVRFLTAVETHLVEKAMVDLVWSHIKFTNIWPLEGSVGVFICILCRSSRILTTCAAKWPIYG